MNLMLMPLFVVCTMYCSVFAIEHSQQKLTKAARNEPDCVRVSWFGFDVDDSTRYVQAAIDSDARRIVIDRMQQGPWVVRPLLIRKSGKEIVFEDGAELVAKRGEYLSEHDSLLRLKRVKDIIIRGKGTIRMWHDDYLKPPYPLAEWRHGISATSVENLMIDGLTVRDTGGDGLYIGVAGGDHVPCRNVVVRNCVFDRNSRQGISVISVDGFTVENTVMSRTMGRPPQAGIDFEPNNVAHVFKRCVLCRCEFSGNKGAGVEVYLANFNAESEPVDIRLEDCRLLGNSCSFRYSVESGGWSNPFDDGMVVFDRCDMERAEKFAVSVKRKRFACGKTIFRNCRIVDACTSDPTNADVRVDVTGSLGAEPASIVFDNMSIRQRMSRKWISIGGEKRFDGIPTVISGRIDIESPEGITTEILDRAWHTNAFPCTLHSAFGKPLSIDAENAVVYDGNPGAMEQFDQMYVRGKNRMFYVFYSDSARTIHFRGIQKKIGERGPTAVPLLFCDMKSWKPIANSPIPGFAETDFSFAAPAAGFYRISLDTRGNGFAITACDAPIAFNVCRENVPLVSSVGRLYFYVPGNACATCLISGGGKDEGCGLELLDRNGESVYRDADIFDPVQISVPKEAEGRLRTFKLLPPERGVNEDIYVGVFDAPGFLFLSQKKYWR